MSDRQRHLPGVAKILGENPDKPRGQEKSEMAEILEMIKNLNAEKTEAGSEGEEDWDKKIAAAKKRLTEIEGAEGVDVDVRDL